MKRLFFALACAGALWASACSNGGTTTPPPPPPGMYSTASLNGTYAFMTSGEIITAAGSANFVRVGSFQADGQGNITGGVYDLNAQGSVTTANSINTGSKYTMNADGKGTLTFEVNSASGPAMLNFAIVLTSTSAGLIMDETFTASQSSTGSGNFVKQNTALFQASTVNNTYAFDFSGLDSSQAPLSLVGEFGASGGSLTGGFDDANDGINGLSSGPISAGGGFGSDPANASTLASFGRGLVTIAGETYAFYIVDGTRVRMISASASGQMLSGDAIQQDGTVPASASAISGGYVFLIAGSSATAGITRVGSFTTTAGAISALHEDTNIGTSDLTADGNTGTIVVDPSNPGIPGRFLVTINNAGSAAPFTAVIYFSSLSAGVMQETSVASGSTVDVADGSFNIQSGTPSSSSVTGPFAFDWSGQTVQNGNLAEEDISGQLTATNLSLSGTSDQYEVTATNGPAPNISTSGAIMIASGGTGRNTMNVTLGSNAQISFVIYFANPGLAYFANTSTQNTRIVAGVLQAQH